MSEITPQQAFKEFITKFQDKLNTANPDDANKDNCLPYIEQLSVYKEFTDGLIKNGSKFLGIISYLKDELAKNDNDVQSTTSVGSSSIQDGKILEDLDFLRRCLDKRVGMEEQAMTSLVDLEGIVDALIRENRKLDDENRRLKNQLKNTEHSACVPIDDDITANVIATLQQENDDLKQIINRNRQTMNMIRNKSSDSSSESDDQRNDCEEQLELLKRQLAERDRRIEELLAKLKDLSKAKARANASEPNDSESDSDKPSDKSDDPNKSDASTSSSSNESQSLTDLEKKDEDKLQKLKDGYKELATLLREKYDKLRKQREKIKDLTKQLEKCADTEKEALELKDLVAQLRQKNDDLAKELQDLKTNVPSDDIKNYLELCSNQLESAKQREILLARKLAMQEENQKTLLDERENMIQIQNDMLNSILKCKTELAKYNV